MRWVSWGYLNEARHGWLDWTISWSGTTKYSRWFGFSGTRKTEVLRTLFSGDLLDAAQLLQFQTFESGRDWGDTLSAFQEHPEHAPLYYALGRLASSLPFSPVVSLRGLSAVFGILLIPACYWLMRELFGRGPIPWVSATLIAFSPLQYLYAQEARQYALGTLLGAAPPCAATVGATGSFTRS